MVEPSVLKLIQYIVATATRKGFSSLWTIHVVKYLYLVDYYNAKSESKSLTKWDWKFWNFGPWTAQSYTAVQEAIDKGFIQTKTNYTNRNNSKLDEANEYVAFFVDPSDMTDSEYERLGREVIPHIRTRMALDSMIGKFGFKTNPLLHYVYNRTEPMQDVSKGDLLDFDNLSWPETNKVENKPIKKRKIKKAKSIFEKIKNLDKPTYNPPKGKFDDLYFKCVDILNEQDELEVEDGLTAMASIKDVVI